MHIVLIYPPPWKIAVPGEVLSDHSEGPPVGLDSARCLSGDILNIPYGLLSLAAQARAAGHSVTVLNLFAFAWQDIKRILEHYPADLFGLSCFTSNRRGTLYVSHLIKKLYPDAHVSVGGPHASAFPVEMLQHCEALDTVVVGEGEETFAELIGRLEEGFAVSGIAGSVWREGGTITAGPPRKRIAKLDRLVPPFDHFNEYILLTSRGCPWDCTFCASTCMWGRAHHYHSASYVLDMLETIVNGNGQKAVAVKDETFTDNREHVFSICRGIRERGLNFIWSCDTRADRLDEELLAAMRLAGCQRLSLGVESASPKILASLNKRSSPEEVRRATALAKQFGFQIRFYMIGGSRGETRQTLQESIDFVQSVKPSQAVFSPFTLFPGTRDFALAEQDGKVSRNLFLRAIFLNSTPCCLKTGRAMRGIFFPGLFSTRAYMRCGTMACGPGKRLPPGCRTCRRPVLIWLRPAMLPETLTERSSRPEKPWIWAIPLRAWCITTLPVSPHPGGICREPLSTLSGPGRAVFTAWLKQISSGRSTGLKPAAPDGVCPSTLRPPILLR